MGYYIHITRAPDFHPDNLRHEISGEEWLSCFAQGPELSVADVNGEYFAIWSGPSQYEQPWFNLTQGNISTKNPDPPVIAKAIAIAAKLNARVQGDDGEIYLAEGKVEQNGEIDQSLGMDWREW